jgi:hypothetical protein
VWNRQRNNYEKTMTIRPKHKPTRDSVRGSVRKFGQKVRSENSVRSSARATTEISARDSVRDSTRKSTPGSAQHPQPTGTARDSSQTLTQSPSQRILNPPVPNSTIRPPRPVLPSLNRKTETRFSRPTRAKYHFVHRISILDAQNGVEWFTEHVQQPRTRLRGATSSAGSREITGSFFPIRTRTHGF